MDSVAKQTSIELREPSIVMRLKRLGSFHQSRLSFMRILLRRLRDENWQFSTQTWAIDDTGVGHAVLTAKGPERSYSLVAFSHDLPDEMRSDRVIATAWDCTFALFDGVPTKKDIERLSNNVPYQEEGRVSAKELSLSRANRSMRVWNHTVESLAAGNQPDADLIRSVGYLMRTTAVYGSGKFGAADREKICNRPEFAAPFQVEMLNVYLIRTFVIDLVEHMARAKGGTKSATLDPDLRRTIGIGNSTGLGMAPFLVHHPRLLNAWIAARETALARVCSIRSASSAAKTTILDILFRAKGDIANWNTQHEYYRPRIDELSSDLDLAINQLNNGILENSFPFSKLITWSANALHMEAQELLASIVLEPHGHLVDDLSTDLSCDEERITRIDGTKSIRLLKQDIKNRFDWAINIDHTIRNGEARFWYVSEAKLEPRLGERYEEEGGELEQPLGVSRDICSLVRELENEADDTLVGTFLLTNPQHRNAVRRVQMAARHVYSEIQDNLLDQHMMPVDMLRCKLSFFGATKFDPRSDRWVRICMFQNAPFPHELAGSKDDWVYPETSQH